MYCHGRISRKMNKCLVKLTSLCETSIEWVSVCVCVCVWHFCANKCSLTIVWTNVVGSWKYARYTKLPVWGLKALTCVWGHKLVETAQHAHYWFLKYICFFWLFFFLALVCACADDVDLYAQTTEIRKWAVWSVQGASKPPRYLERQVNVIVHGKISFFYSVPNFFLFI